MTPRAGQGLGGPCSPVSPTHTNPAAPPPGPRRPPRGSGQPPRRPPPSRPFPGPVSPPPRARLSGPPPRTDPSAGPHLPPLTPRVPPDSPGRPGGAELSGPAKPAPPRRHRPPADRLLPRHPRALRCTHTCVSPSGSWPAGHAGSLQTSWTAAAAGAQLQGRFPPPPARRGTCSRSRDGGGAARETRTATGSRAPHERWGGRRRPVPHECGPPTLHPAGWRPSHTATCSHAPGLTPVLLLER